jgi:hypothetical protein
MVTVNDLGIITNVSESCARTNDSAMPGSLSIPAGYYRTLLPLPPACLLTVVSSNVTGIRANDSSQPERLTIAYNRH